MTGNATVFQHIQVIPDSNVAVIRLAQPEIGNALTTDLLAELNSALRLISGARVLVLAALGRDFSIGRPPASYSEPLSSLQHAYHLIISCNEQLADFPGVTLSIVQGRAIGAGCSLACRCDIVLAGETARFSFPELRKGVLPAIVAAYYAKRIPWRAFLDMVLSGREIPADEAVRIGLVTRVVPDHVLDTEAMGLAQQLSTLSPGPVRQLKTFLRDVETLSTRQSNRLALTVLLESLAARQSEESTGGKG